MDQQGIQANSSEAANIQVSSKTTNVIEKADFTTTTEYKGKFGILLMVRDGASY